MQEPQTAGGPNARRFTIPPAFRYPAYRVYFPGLVTMAGAFQAFQLSLVWLAFNLTGSPLYLGYVGLASALPTIALNLLGGVAADKLDKRRLLITTTVLSGLLIFALATLTLLDLVNIWHVLVIALLTGSVNAFDMPARNAIYPQLMDRSAMTSGIALDSSVWWGTRIFSPALAGFIIAVAGTATALYLACAGMFISAAIMSLVRLRPMTLAPTGSPVRRMLEGVKYIRRNPTIAFLLGMGFYASFFGASYTILMPVFAEEILDVGPEGLGILMSAGSLGAIIASVWVGAAGDFPRRGLVLIGGTALAGLSLAAFGLANEYGGSYLLSIVLMFAVGSFSSLHGIANVTSLQLLLPDQMRGRVMGIHSISYTIPTLGGMPMGAIANVIGAPFAVAIGGLAVTAFALGPALLNWRIRNLSALVHQAEEARLP